MYYVRRKGRTVKLDGSEKYFAKCNNCGKEINFDVDELIGLAAKDGLYGSTWYCADCTEERNSK